MNPARAKELLAAHRERIERSLAELDASDNAASHLDRDELDAGIADDLRQELAAVERAESRLEDRTYGRSIESGTVIPDERLEVIPWAERTTDEQDRYERGG